MLPGTIQVIPIHGMAEIQPGDSIVAAVLGAAQAAQLAICSGDVLVLKHKIIAKSEGRIVRLAEIKPSARARSWAARWKRDARLIELALQNAGRVVRMSKGVLITQTPHGFVCANSGIDVSNVDGGTSAVLLPVDADASARRIMAGLRRKLKLHIPVIIADSFGRPWREGLVEAAIGVAGLKPLRDLRGRRDQHGYTLHATAEAVADELASLAGLACGKFERVPACIVRGFCYQPGRGSVSQLLRPPERDLFR